LTASRDYQVSVDPVDLDETSGFFDSPLLVLVGWLVVDTQGLGVAVDASDATRVTDVSDVNL
jgi:hypothetical protein